MSVSIPKPKKIPKLPPYSLDWTGSTPSATFTSKDWSKHIMGGPHDGDYPLLWTGPTIAKFSGLSEADIITDGLAVTPTLFNRKNYIIKPPKAVMFVTSVLSPSDIITALSTVMDQLIANGIYVILPPLSVRDGFLLNIPCDTVVSSTDSGYTISGGSVVPRTINQNFGVPDPTKFIGGQYLIFDTQTATSGEGEAGTFGETGTYGGVMHGPVTFADAQSKAGASLAGVAACFDKFETYMFLALDPAESSNQSALDSLAITSGAYSGLSSSGLTMNYLGIIGGSSLIAAEQPIILSETKAFFGLH